MSRGAALGLVLLFLGATIGASLWSASAAEAEAAREESDSGSFAAREPREFLQREMATLTKAAQARPGQPERRR